MSIRIEDALHERLVRQSRGSSKSTLAARLIDEGLRMQTHPGIVFRPGPAGRRPGLIGGPDVWEVARVLRDAGGQGEQRLRRAADLTGLPLHQVRAADSYYGEFSEEIDAWIDEVDREAESAR